MEWKKYVPKFVTKSWQKWTEKANLALVAFKPTHIPKNSQYFSPVVVVIALITVIFGIAIAITSFLTLFTSLLVLYFVLSKIFGLDFNPNQVYTV